VITSKVERITPEMAAAILASNKQVNRKEEYKTIDRYANEM
jgi:hypothetical protein